MFEAMAFRPARICVLLLALVSAARAADDLVVTRADRKIDVQSHVPRVILSIKVENTGKEPVSRVLLGLTRAQEASLAFATVVLVTGKAKSRSFTQLEITPLPVTDPSYPPSFKDSPLALLSADLPEPIQPGGTALLEAYMTFSGLLKPFPTEISQADSQLLLYTDNSYVPTPYSVKLQNTVVKLPSSRVERHVAASPSRKSDTELRLGPYENVAPGSESQLLAHFESNRPMPVAAELTRELEVSHWGNVYVTEDYDVTHEGAVLKGVFSRLELQMRPHSSGVHSLKGLIAYLPKSVRSVYFRDEIGNISTSNLRTESRRSVLELSPRYPLFGGWRTTFTLGYSVPLSDLVFVLPDGTRMLNATFGTPFQELPVRKITVKVVLPEGSYGISVDTPFTLSAKRAETKYSYLDTVGRPVVVMEKDNIVQEHGSQYFQVKYKFSPVSLLSEPLLLVGAFALFFVVCAVYVRLDLTIAKSSPAYLAKMQTDLLMDGVQRLQSAVRARMASVDALEVSLTRLGRTGDTAQAKSARKAQEDKIKEHAKGVKDALTTIEAVPRAAKTQALAQQMAAKDKEFVEKALKKHITSVEAYEKSTPEKEIEESIAPLVDRLATLKAELKGILTSLDEM